MNRISDISLFSFFSPVESINEFTKEFFLQNKMAFFQKLERHIDRTRGEDLSEFFTGLSETIELADIAEGLIEEKPEIFFKFFDSLSESQKKDVRTSLNNREEVPLKILEAMRKVALSEWKSFVYILERKNWKTFNLMVPVKLNLELFLNCEFSDSFLRRFSNTLLTHFDFNYTVRLSLTPRNIILFNASKNHLQNFLNKLSFPDGLDLLVSMAIESSSETKPIIIQYFKTNRNNPELLANIYENAPGLLFHYFCSLEDRAKYLLAYPCEDLNGVLNEALIGAPQDIIVCFSESPLFQKLFTQIYIDFSTWEKSDLRTFDDVFCYFLNFFRCVGDFLYEEDRDILKKIPGCLIAAAFLSPIYQLDMVKFLPYLTPEQIRALYFSFGNGNSKALNKLVRDGLNSEQYSILLEVLTGEERLEVLRDNLKTVSAEYDSILASKTMTDHVRIHKLRYLLGNPIQKTLLSLAVVEFPELKRFVEKAESFLAKLAAVPNPPPPKKRKKDDSILFLGTRFDLNNLSKMGIRSTDDLEKLGISEKKDWKKLSKYISQNDLKEFWLIANKNRFYTLSGLCDSLVIEKSETCFHLYENYGAKLKESAPK